MDRFMQIAVYEFPRNLTLRLSDKCFENASTVDLGWPPEDRAFRYVARPLLCLEADPPRRWPGRGEVVRVERLLLLCVVPAWSHELRFVRLDDEEREMLTNERGGPIRKWNHRIRVEPLSERLCQYTDEVEVHAGVLTP